MPSDLNQNHTAKSLNHKSNNNKIAHQIYFKKLIYPSTINWNAFMLVDIIGLANFRSVFFVNPV